MWIVALRWIFIALSRANPALHLYTAGIDPMNNHGPITNDLFLIKIMKWVLYVCRSQSKALPWLLPCLHVGLTRVPSHSILMSYFTKNLGFVFPHCSINLTENFDPTEVSIKSWPDRAEHERWKWRQWEYESSSAPDSLEYLQINHAVRRHLNEGFLQNCKKWGFKKRRCIMRSRWPCVSGWLHSGTEKVSCPLFHWNSLDVKKQKY